MSKSSPNYFFPTWTRGILLLIFLLASYSKASGQTFSPDQLKEDFAIYKQGIYEVHPAPFQWYPRDSFDVWLADIEAQLVRPFTEMEFRKLLFPVHQKLGCGHSRVRPSSKRIKREKKLYKKGASRWFLPFEAKVYSGRIYITKDHTPDSLLEVGTELIALNGLPAKALIDSLTLFFTSDGYNTTHFNRGINRQFSALHRAFFGEQFEYFLDLRDSIGNTRSLTLAARVRTRSLDKQEKKEKQRNRKVEPAKETKVSDKPAEKKLIITKKRYKLFQAEADSALFILRIPSFAGKKGIRFYKKCFKYLNQLPFPTELILDLRNNGGGSAKESTTLISMLLDKPFTMEARGYQHIPRPIFKHLSIGKWGRDYNKFMFGLRGKKSIDSDTLTYTFKRDPHKKYQYKGPVYLFNDGYTFSASTLVGAYLQDAGRSKALGEETGGGQFGTNALSMPHLILPNSDLKIRMPQWRLVHHINGQDQGRGIFPDFPVSEKIEDFLSGSDPYLKALFIWRKDAQLSD
ncbi:MAG: hypothetical protein HKN16_06405, partial [Saprospiraceae bacterium]|nr:hypothetical protein [Saprospiraceae bacterium]